MNTPQSTLDPTAVRLTILAQSRRANVGHIGSCLCVVEILVALYSRVLRVASADAPDRDRFILSKGHAALALYAVLAEYGLMARADLDMFCGEDTRLGVHPEATVPGIDFSTGSLGHGLSMAAGAALAARMQRSPRRVFCLISDAECNEGSVWEAAMFAAARRLGNLTVVVDWNGQQALGRTADVLECTNLPARWAAFGWRTVECDGHSISDLTALLRDEGAEPGAAPLAVFARTVFGKGVSYMEQGVPVSRTDLPTQPITWHYLPMTAHEYALALAELERGR